MCAADSNRRNLYISGSKILHFVSNTWYVVAVEFYVSDPLRRPFIPHDKCFVVMLACHPPPLSNNPLRHFECVIKELFPSQFIYMYVLELSFPCFCKVYNSTTLLWIVLWCVKRVQMKCWTNWNFGILCHLAQVIIRLIFWQLLAFSKLEIFQCSICETEIEPDTLHIF